MVEPVDVIDAKTGDQSLLGQPERELVHRSKDHRIFDPDGGQIVDVEEATVVDLVGRDAPRTQPVSLIYEQRRPVRRSLQRRRAGRAGRQHALEGVAEMRIMFEQRGDPSPDDRHLVLTLWQAIGGVLETVREPDQRAHDALELEHAVVGIAQHLAHWVSAGAKSLVQDLGASGSRCSP